MAVEKMLTQSCFVYSRNRSRSISNEAASSVGYTCFLTK